MSHLPPDIKAPSGFRTRLVVPHRDTASNTDSMPAETEIPIFRPLSDIATACAKRAEIPMALTPASSQHASPRWVPAAGSMTAPRTSQAIRSCPALLFRINRPHRGTGRKTDKDACGIRAVLPGPGRRGLSRNGSMLASPNQASMLGPADPRGCTHRWPRIVSSNSAAKLQRKPHIVFGDHARPRFRVNQIVKFGFLKFGLDGAFVGKAVH